MNVVSARRPDKIVPDVRVVFDRVVVFRWRTRYIRSLAPQRSHRYAKKLQRNHTLPDCLSCLYISDDAVAAQLAARGDAPARHRRCPLDNNSHQNVLLGSAPGIKTLSFVAAPHVLSAV